MAAQPLQRDVNPLQIKPLGRDLYKATLTMRRSMRDKLREAKDLLGYRKELPDEAEILESGLDLYLAWLKKQKFGSPDRRRAARRSKDPAYISPAVRRQVHERDGGRCSFVSDTGVRCPETRGLEGDHIVPVAQGGTSEPGNLRLRCRAHNQLEAERTFGKAFMDNKRELAKAAAKRRRWAAKRTPEEAAREDQQIIDWIVFFRHSAEDARWALQQVHPEDFPLFGYRRDRCLRLVQERAQKRSA